MKKIVLLLTIIIGICWGEGWYNGNLGDLGYEKLLIKAWISEGSIKIEQVINKCKDPTFKLTYLGRGGKIYENIGEKDSYLLYCEFLMNKALKDKDRNKFIEYSNILTKRGGTNSYSYVLDKLYHVFNEKASAVAYLANDCLKNTKAKPVAYPGVYSCSILSEIMEEEGKIQSAFDTSMAACKYELNYHRLAYMILAYSPRPIQYIKLKPYIDSFVKSLKARSNGSYNYGWVADFNNDSAFGTTLASYVLANTFEAMYNETKNKKYLILAMWVVERFDWSNTHNVGELDLDYTYYRRIKHLEVVWERPDGRRLALKGLIKKLIAF